MSDYAQALSRTDPVPWDELILNKTGSWSLKFDLPPELEAGAPPEARGLERDQVRLMVSHFSDHSLVHSRFHCLPDFLESGDTLVINTSGTLSASLNVERSDGAPLELHLSTRLPGDLWVVELRQPENGATTAFYHGISGEKIFLPGGAWTILHTPYRSDQRSPQSNGAPVRLWIASLHLPLPWDEYLDRHGFPIRYPYVKEGWPNEYYQTLYATEKGSAEMPSAGRAFTAELITRLVSIGVRFAPLILHTGVASLEKDEPPYEEFYRIPHTTAELVNNARAGGRRIIAVGTTSVRALETMSDSHGILYPGEGWTDVFITPDHRMKLVDGLITGLHEPESTHLSMLAALAGFEHLSITYREALKQRYLWHEFGDMHLILP
jgi:S-adenosylmethionine:tRNA ribosyltransferase-isomerase